MQQTFALFARFVILDGVFRASFASCRWLNQLAANFPLAATATEFHPASEHHYMPENVLAVGLAPYDLPPVKERAEPLFGAHAEELGLDRRERARRRLHSPTFIALSGREFK